METILEITFRSFWHFVGMALLFSLVCNLVFCIYNRLMRHLNIRSQGWPPEHCDADGDFEASETDDED